MQKDGLAVNSVNSNYKQRKRREEGSLHAALLAEGEQNQTKVIYKHISKRADTFIIINTCSIVERDMRKLQISQ